MGEVNHGVLDKLDQANKTLSEKYAHFWNAAIKYITFFYEIPQGTSVVQNTWCIKWRRKKSLNFNCLVENSHQFLLSSLDIYLFMSYISSRWKVILFCSSSPLSQILWNLPGPLMLQEEGGEKLLSSKETIWKWSFCECFSNLIKKS